MPKPPPTIRTEGLGLRFGGRAVFENLSLTLEGGRWTGLLGRSGVGKSSLLKALAGLQEESNIEGAIRSDDGAPLEGRITYMAQQDLLLPWLSALDNVTLGSRLRAGRAAASAGRARAESLLERVGLADRAADRPGSLSGGMRQRVALARTLMEDRPIVLMDEPFCALDAITRFRLQELAARLMANATVFLVTHDPLEALRLCHKVYVLQGGHRPIGPPIQIPDSAPPRSSDDPALLLRQGELLRQLADLEAAA